MALLVVLVVLGASPAADALSAPADPGAGKASPPQQVGTRLEGLRLGRAGGPCHGLFELADDPGACSHGPDAQPAGGGTTAAAVEGDLPRSPATATTAMPCVGDGKSGNRIQMLYVRAADVADRFATYARTLQNYGNDVDAVFTKSAQRSGGPDVHARFLTSADCRPVISAVTLSSTGDDTFNNTITELKALGYNRSDRTYLLWTDANVYCGIATMMKDDRATSANANNSGASFSRVDNRCWNGPTAAHELAHNFGAIQASAPHSTAGGHCTDGHDLMCYSDGPGVTMSYGCAEPGQFFFDCNHDNYFSAKPAAGSYLATHWNMASNCRLTLVPCGADNTLTVMPADSTPPATPSGLALTPASQTSLTLRWDPADDNVGVAGYRVKRDGGAYYWYRTGDTRITDTGLQPGITYSYTVEAYDASGNVSAVSAPVKGESVSDVTAPSVPASLAVSALTSTSVSLTWKASTDDFGVAGYRVYRDGVAVTSTNTTAFEDTKVTRGATYVYTVAAYDRAGNESGASAPVRVTVLDTTPPSAPSHLSSPSQTSSSITLGWGASSDDVGVAGYRVYRDGVIVATTSGTTATDGGLRSKTTYSYTVRAFDAAGNVSPESAALTLRTKILCAAGRCL